MDVVYIVLFFIFGVVMGSFYNVLGYRLPLNKSIVFPSSSCTKCNHKLFALDLIPILSFIFLGGRCRYCRDRISWFYPVVELFTGILFAVCFYSFSFSYNLGIALVLVSLLMCVMVSDLLYMIIPDSFVVVSALIILVLKFLSGGVIGGVNSLVSALIMFGIMYLVMVLGKVIFKKEALGGGDVKLLAVIGLVFNPFLSILALFIASLIAFPISLVLYKKNKDSVIPFGPFLLVGTLIIFFTKIDYNMIVSWFI